MFKTSTSRSVNFENHLLFLSRNRFRPATCLTGFAIDFVKKNNAISQFLSNLALASGQYKDAIVQADTAIQIAGSIDLQRYLGTVYMMSGRLQSRK